MLRFAPTLWLGRVVSVTTPPLRPFTVLATYKPRRSFGSTGPRRWQTSAVLKARPDYEVEPCPTDSVIEPESSSVVLRPYQEAAITSCLEALESGLTRIGVSSPTGSGKTTMFMSLIPKVRKQQDRKRTLIIVSSVELSGQAEGAARRLLGPGWTVEVEQGKRVASGTADVTIGTYQTLSNPERLQKFDPTKFKLIIVDEAHHAAAFSYLRLLHHFNKGVELPSMLSSVDDAQADRHVPIIGFSATFSRPDQLALSAVFEKIVFHREVTTMLDEGWLSPARSTTVQCDLHLDQVETNSTGDFKISSLAPHVNTTVINDLIVRTYLHRAGDRRSTLIFCVDLSHVANVTRAFRDAGIDARSVSSLSAGKGRKETLDAFAKGDFPVLVNCEVLTEGADIPVIDCIMLARPTKSRNLLAQMVGRGLRLSPESGKENCLIVDIVDSIGRANGMLVSPTLFGLTHDELAQAERERQEMAAEDGALPQSAPDGTARVRKVTFVDEDDPFRVASPSRPPIARISSNAWVACGGDRYILEMLGRGYITVEPNETEEGGRWSIKYRRKIQIGPVGSGWFSQLTKVGTADDLERAMQTADKYAERTIGREMYSKISRYADWRQRPASPKALMVLMKMKGIKKEDNAKVIDIMGKVVKIDRLKAGEVAAYLCACTHGAMAQTVRKKADQITARKLQREQVKADKARAAEARNLPLPRSE